MKILHYIPAIDKASAGVGAYMQLLTRDLGKLCELHVLTHKNEDELELENCQVHYMPYKWLPWNNCKREFWIILDEIQPDVFHTNCCWMPVSALTAMWAKEQGYKVVYTPHGMLEPYSIARHYWTKKLPAILLFQRKGLKVCDCIHATAESEKMNLLKLGWNSNVQVVPNCVQTDKISCKTSWSKTKTILFLSRVHPKKGIEFLLEAVAELREEMNGYQVIIAGPGEKFYVDSLLSMVERLKLTDIARFVGPVFEEEKWKLYRQADLFVLPTYSENFGIVVPEALASGTPVITTVGTPWEELNTNHCGWWTAIGTKPLVEALRQFLQCDEQELETMGLNGLQLVRDNYSSESVAIKMRDLYQWIINKGEKPEFVTEKEY